MRSVARRCTQRGRLLQWVASKRAVMRTTFAVRQAAHGTLPCDCQMRHVTTCARKHKHELPLASPCCISCTHACIHARPCQLPMPSPALPLILSVWSLAAPATPAAGQPAASPCASLSSLHALQTSVHMVAAATAQHLDLLPTSFSTLCFNAPSTPLPAPTRVRRSITYTLQYGGVLSAVVNVMSPRGPGCCDHNGRERVANLITSLPYAWIGIHGIR